MVEKVKLTKIGTLSIQKRTHNNACKQITYLYTEINGKAGIFPKEVQNMKSETLKKVEGGSPSTIYT